jgi:polygalacturonase
MKMFFILCSILFFPYASFSAPSEKEIYNITNFGAVGDNKTLNSEAIQEAINKCAEKGGGTVYVPAGIFITGAIQLKSNINLCLENGAVLKAKTEKQYYKAIDNYTHNEMGTVYSWIWARDQHNISISGRGELLLDGKNFIDSTIVQYDSTLDKTQNTQTTLRMGWRPNQSIFFQNCHGIDLTTIKVSDAPQWTIVFSECDKINIHGVWINNSPRIPNNDGFHLCSCTDVIISDCRIYTGDDAIAISGITCWNKVSKNILVSNSILSSSSAAVRIGFLESKIQNVQLNNLVIQDSNRGILIATGKGGWVKNVTVDNVIMDVHIKAGAWWGKGEPFLIFADSVDQGLKHIRRNYDPTLGLIENITISNVISNAENSAILYNRSIVRNINISNCTFIMNDSHNRQLYGNIYDIQPSPIKKRRANTIAGIYAEEITDLTLNNVIVKNNLKMQKELSTKIQVVKCKFLSKRVSYL